MLLDTMVVSDLGKPRPDPNLVAWSRATDLERAFISVVTVEEIELAILLKERRHGGAPRLRRWFAESVLDGFSGRILPITAAVARRAAALHVEQTRPANDARIAATALTHGLTLVTRNAAHFAGTGVTLVNPWTGFSR